MKKKNIVVGSGKGGVGKSMLTSALSMLFAKDEKIVAVDCDADAPNLAIWLNEANNLDKTIPVTTSAKPEINYEKCTGCGLCAENCRFSAIKMVKGKPKVNPFLCEGCGACEVICPEKAITLKPVQNGEIKIKKTKYGFPLVSGQLFPGETGSGKVVAEIKNEAKKFKRDITIIDSSPGTGCPVIAALQDADFAILITEPTPSGFTDLKRILEVVLHFNIHYEVVINKWDINKKLSQEIEKWASRQSQGKLLGKISYDKNIFKAVAELKPILETDLKANEEIKKIYSNLKNHLKWLGQEKKE